MRIDAVGSTGERNQSLARHAVVRNSAAGIERRVIEPPRVRRVLPIEIARHWANSTAVVVAPGLPADIAAEICDMSVGDGIASHRRCYRAADSHRVSGNRGSIAVCRMVFDPHMEFAD